LTRCGDPGSTTPVSTTPRDKSHCAKAATWLLAICIAAPAAAQQAEQITVVPTGPAASPAGTTVLGAGDIARSGAGTLGALLDQVPSFGSQGVNGAQNDGGFGEYFIDLRNLNFDRTLVLVDGQRFVLSGIQTDEAVDLNNIPAAFVDHVEVLRDGSQPQYAADAVAGVVNIVLKDQVDGIRLDTYGAAAGAGGDGTAEASLVAGHSLPDGHVALGLDFFRRDPVLQSDRAWAADPIASATQTPAGPVVLFGSPATPGGHAVAPGVDALALGQGAFRPYDAATDDYNDAAARYLQGGLQRETAYFDADEALTDSITANTELLFSDRSAATLGPPQTIGLTGTLKHPDGFVIPASDPYNPFGMPVTLERVVTEAGPQQTTTGGPVWRVLAGLDGTLGSWGWSASFDRGQSVSHYVTENEINLTRALQTAGAGPCPASLGCVEADWFGPNSLSPQALSYIGYTGRSQSSYTETAAQARVAGPLFTLPGGAARLALGAQARAESGATTVDAVTAQGNQAGQDAAPTSGGYDSYDAYTTLTLPWLAGLPYAQRLDTALAARETATSRYGTFGTGRAALNYVPVAGLRLTAVIGAARRPPAISEAFGGIIAGPQPVTDPCAQGSGLRANPVVNANCLAQGLGPGFTQSSATINVLSGGNPHLQPENSTNATLGVSIAPPAWPWLAANVDWYHYHIGNAIDSLEDTDPNFVPDTCYESTALSSPLCALITRIPGGGNKGQISSILGLDQNVGTIKTDGLDFGVTLTTPQTALGRLRLDCQTTWLLNYRLHSIGQTGYVQYAGTFPGLSGVGSYARVRSRATADWQLGPWSVGWTGRFISGARVLAADPADLYTSAPGVLYQDLDISRSFGRLTAMAGVENLADVRPPTLIDGETNTSTSTYDVVGRVIWARVSYVF
jgi:outer membrane receptor protein involved in Fe transport